jgi:hypothetical protein
MEAVSGGDDHLCKRAELSSPPQVKKDTNSSKSGQSIPNDGVMGGFAMQRVGFALQ